MNQPTNTLSQQEIEQFWLESDNKKADDLKKDLLTFLENLDSNRDLTNIIDSFLSLQTLSELVRSKIIDDARIPVGTGGESILEINEKVRYKYIEQTVIWSVVAGLLFYMTPYSGAIDSIAGGILTGLGTLMCIKENLRNNIISRHIKLDTDSFIKERIRADNSIIFKLIQRYHDHYSKIKQMQQDKAESNTPAIEIPIPSENSALIQEWNQTFQEIIATTMQIVKKLQFMREHPVRYI